MKSIISEETRRKLSIANSGDKNYFYGKHFLGESNPFFGRHHSEETKEKIRRFRIGKKTSDEVKAKMSVVHSGANNHFYGKHHSEETKKKMKERIVSNENRLKLSQYHKGKHLSSEAIEKVRRYMLDHSKGEDNNFWGKRHSKESCLKMSESRTGEKNYRWLGGVGFLPYTKEFNRQIKEMIRDRDNHVCQKCGVTEIELTRNLDIHHIDYRKWNSLPTNLISLCNKCHVVTNGNRTYWTAYFTTLLNRRTLKVVNK